MAYTYENISTTTVLRSKSDLYNNPIVTMNICNTHSSDSTISLYLKTIYGNAISGYEKEEETKTTETYYMIKNLIIPSGTTLQLDGSDIYIDYNNVIYDLYVEVDNTIDVIINSKK
tara:strand:+ start:5225 stop:5572 length:348 start_codon:yes stop_codon:yes gene_type:complete